MGLKESTKRHQGAQRQAWRISKRPRSYWYIPRNEEAVRGTAMGGTVDRMFMSEYRDIDASGVGPANGREIQFVESVENQAFGHIMRRVLP